MEYALLEITMMNLVVVRHAISVVIQPAATMDPSPILAASTDSTNVLD